MEIALWEFTHTFIVQFAIYIYIYMHMKISLVNLYIDVLLYTFLSYIINFKIIVSIYSYS